MKGPVRPGFERWLGQNIDRLVSLYRAAKRAGRLFVLDLYGATIAAATNLPGSIPQASWSDVRVFVALSQRLRVKREGAFNRIAPIRPARLYPEDLARLAGRLVLRFRGSMGAETARANCLSGATALWSMWPGYLEQPSAVRLRSWLDAHDIPLTITHASGHATVADLQRLVEAMRPEQVVPIHTHEPERFRERLPITTRYRKSSSSPLSRPACRITRSSTRGCSTGRGGTGRRS